MWTQHLIENERRADQLRHEIAETVERCLERVGNDATTTSRSARITEAGGYIDSIMSKTKGIITILKSSAAICKTLCRLSVDRHTDPDDAADIAAWKAYLEGSNGTSDDNAGSR